MASAANTVRVGEWGLHRHERGAPVGADVAISASFPTRGVPVSTEGYDKVLVVAELVGAGATCTIESYYYNSQDDLFYLGKTSAGLTDKTVFEFDCYGQRVFFRISAVANAPTDIKVKLSAARRN